MNQPTSNPAATAGAVRRPEAPGRLHREPWIGLLAFFIAMMWKPLAHAISVLNHTLFPGMTHYASGAVLGGIGFVLVWVGFRKDELTATCLGFMGGSLIFMGLVEASFWMFAELMGVPPLVVEGRTVLSPNLVLMQASAVCFFVLLIFLGADKDTKCRMFLWFHRNLGLRPNLPTAGYRRQASRITALETIMISWFFYILIITALDPRVLGRDHPVTLALFWIMIAWGLWLLFFRLARYRAMAPAIRYAIPVAGIIWYGFEMAAQWQWYTEIWVRPVQWPVSNLIIGALFVGGGILANLTRRRGAEAEA